MLERRAMRRVCFYLIATGTLLAGSICDATEDGPVSVVVSTEEWLGFLKPVADADKNIRAELLAKVVTMGQEEIDRRFSRTESESTLSPLSLSVKKKAAIVCNLLEWYSSEFAKPYRDDSETKRWTSLRASNYRRRALLATEYETEIKASWANLQKAVSVLGLPQGQLDL